MQRAGAFDQWRLLRAEPGQPAQNVRVAPQLIESPDVGAMLTQIAKKVFGRGPIAAFGGVAHRSGHRPNGGEEHFGQWMHEWKAESLHGRAGGVGRTSCATARTYCW